MIHVIGRYAAGLMILVLLDCGGGSSNPAPAPAPAPPAPTVPAQRLYVADGAFGSPMRVYTLPLSAGSLPSFTISMPPNCFTIAFNTNGDMVVGAPGSSGCGYVLIFPAPLSASSSPSAIFSVGPGCSAGQFAVAPSGNLFVGMSGGFNMFTPPFTNASIPSSQTSDLNLGTQGRVFDAQGNFYIAGWAPFSNFLDVLPLEGSATPSVRLALPTEVYVEQIALGGGQLFLTNIGGSQSDSVLIYTLPITSNSVPVANITNGIDSPWSVAVDASGNLYVGNVQGNSISVYAPPFSSNSTPILKLHYQGVMGTLAIGK